MQHSVHIEHLPHMGVYHVRCTQGCDLGTTFSQESFDGAVRRAELHESAMRLYSQEETPVVMSPRVYKPSAYGALMRNDPADYSEMMRSEPEWLDYVPTCERCAGKHDLDLVRGVFCSVGR